jgi:hypothetical protein
MAAAPQPPYVTSPTNRWPNPSPSGVLVIVILAVFLFVLMCCALVALFNIARKPRPRPGLNKPVVGKPLGNGWYSYHIPTLELTIAGLAQPKVNPEVQAQIGNRNYLAEFAGYRIDGRSLHCRIVGFWQRTNGAGLKKDTDGQILMLERWHPDYTSCRQSSTLIGGHPANLVTFVYPSKGYSWVTQLAVVYRGNVTYFLDGTYWTKLQKWAVPAFDYMMRSVRFDP